MANSSNVILFGETGAGKSSLINLMAGKEVAPTSKDGGVCTLSHIPYPLQINGVLYTIWDTPGFGQASTGTAAYGFLSALEQAYRFSQNLAARGGVNLLVLCHRAGPVTPTSRNHYRLFYEVLCQTKVPIALVITYLEHHTRMEDWWDQHKEDLKKRHAMTFTSHVCVTGLFGHSKSQESKRAIEGMLGQLNRVGKYNISADEWFQRFLRYCVEFYRPPRGIGKRELKDFLRERCGLSDRDVQVAVAMLRNSDDPKKKFFKGLSMPWQEESSSTKIAHLEETIRELSKSQRAAARENDSLQQKIDTLCNKITDLEQQFCTHAADCHHGTDSLLRILHAHEQRHNCETLYAAGHVVDASLSLLDIINTAGKEVKVNELMMGWLAKFKAECISRLETTGDEAYNAGKQDEAVAAYSTALLLGPTAPPDDLLAKWSSTVLICTPLNDALNAAAKFNLPNFFIYRAICDALEKGGRILEAVECLQRLEDAPGEVTGGRDGQQDDAPMNSVKRQCTEWFAIFKERCLKTLEQHGDIAMDSSLHEDAVVYYTTALALRPLSTDLLTKRSKARVKVGSWQHSLEDADAAIKLDPSSPRGYEARHAALLCAHHYDEAINAYSDMLLKLEQSPDRDTRESRDHYVSPSQTKAAIRSSVKRTQRDAPLVLINTETGRMYDKQERLDEFEASPKSKALVASTMTKRDNSRITPAVQEYFRYAMLSHTWEGAEPLFAEVLHESVYNLAASPTFTKLVKFCMTVREAGLRWAWSGTCCINKTDGSVLQESLTSMFQWYHDSALTIIHLKGVRPRSGLRALMWCLWNTRAWTLQEFFASRIIRFYTEDWTLYQPHETVLNHKDSTAIMSEMAAATGVDAQVLLSLRPGWENVRQNLCLAASRTATKQEDIAYSLFGIFDVSIPVTYGEGQYRALGRLLQEVLTQSGDIAILAWTGQASGYNSCLPMEIGVYREPESSHIPSPIDDKKMDMLVTELRLSAGYHDSAMSLYDQIVLLPSPRIFSRRLTLSCIMFPLRGPVVPSDDSQDAYHAAAPALGDINIRTTDDLSGANGLVLAHPWLKCILDTALPSKDLIVDDDAELFDGPDAPLLSPSHTASRSNNNLTRALRLFARLRQPFGALLLSPIGHNEYKRVASDQPIVVQLLDSISPRDLAQMIRTLDIL